MSKQRIGILGGTFDPVHNGHLRMGLSVLDSGYLDRLLVLPSGLPPHKSCGAPAEDRWKMVVAACACDERLVPSRLEMDRSGKIYTYDTLTALKHRYPDAELYYVIGADTLMQLRSWYRSEEVLSLCTFLVCPRQDGSESDKYRSELKRLSSLGVRFRAVQMEPVRVSSTVIRSGLAAGKIPDGLPVPVQEYCRCKGLYGAAGKIDGIDLWIDRLFAALKPGRFAHSLSVAWTAARLAAIHGSDPLRAEQAGLLHDCAKYYSMDDMRQIAAEHALTDDPAFLDSGALLHSLVGAQVAQDEYGMNDSAVLEAIRYHNTGCAGMSRLAMCVCLADSIEPLRRSYPLLEEVRALAKKSLEKALLLSLEGTAKYVISRGRYLHPRTKDTIRWLRSLAGPNNSRHGAVCPGINHFGGKNMQDQETVLHLARLLYDRKAQDIVALNVSHLTVLCDHMVIASGRTDNQVSSLADAVDEMMAKEGLDLRRSEGRREGRWVILDYGHIIVHLFHRDERAFYGLDRLWNDGTNALDLPFDQTVAD